MKHSINQQKGSAHVVLVIVLVLALLTALGWIFWQNFIYKEPVRKDTDLVVVEENDATKPTEQTEAVLAPLTKQAIESALPVGCSLGISDGSNSFDVTKLTMVTNDSPAQGPLDYKQYGRINNARTWIYVAGGCGSNAGAFVMKSLDGKWKEVAYHVGDAWFVCDKVDGLGIPKEIVGLCLDGSKERAVR